MYSAVQQIPVKEMFSQFRPTATISILLSAGLLMSGCVNESSTSALTNTELEAKQTTHEERYIAGKCNSSNRLASSNQASAALNAKLTEYSQKEATLSAAAKTNVLEELKAKGKTLTELDQVLKTECRSFSLCEFQASTNKQSCSTQKAKFMSADKKLLQFTKSLAKLKTG